MARVNIHGPPGYLLLLLLATMKFKNKLAMVVAHTFNLSPGRQTQVIRFEARNPVVMVVVVVEGVKNVALQSCKVSQSVSYGLFPCLLLS